MTDDLMRRVELTFDPSDVDAAQQLAYKCLSLMRICVRVLWAESNNMRIGRDDATTLNARILEMAVALRLLKWDWLAKDMDALYEELDAVWKSRSGARERI